MECQEAVEAVSVSVAALAAFADAGADHADLPGAHLLQDPDPLRDLADACLDGLAEVADLSAKAITISLSGVASELVSLALQEPYQRRRCRVYFGAIPYEANTDWVLFSGSWSDAGIWVDEAFWKDASSSVELIAVEVFSGSLNTMPIEDSGESSVITATVDSKLVETEKASNLRYTSETQKSRYAGDTFFDYVSAIQDADIVWGRASA